VAARPLGPKRKSSFVSRPLEDSVEAQSLGEERSHFFISASCSNEKGSPAPGGELLFIYTGSVDMNIKSLAPALLRLPNEIDEVSAKRISSGRLKGRFGPGVRYSFLHAKGTLQFPKVSSSRMNPYFSSTTAKHFHMTEKKHSSARP